MSNKGLLLPKPSDNALAAICIDPVTNQPRTVKWTNLADNSKATRAKEVDAMLGSPMYKNVPEGIIVDGKKVVAGFTTDPKSGKLIQTDVIPMGLADVLRPSYDR